MNTLRGGTWNARVTRDPHTVAGEAARIMRRNRLNFLLLQEVEEYRAALMAIPDHQYVSKRIKTKRNEWREVGLLVTDDTVVTNVRNTSVGNGWFGRIVNRWHPGRTFLRATLNGWLRVSPVHAPPGVDLKTHHPKDQWDDYLALMRAVGVFLGARGLSRLAGGDWNKPASNPLEWSPRWVAERRDAMVYAPNKGHGIDYFLAKRCTITGMYVDTETPQGSDHDPVIMVVAQSP